MNKITLLCLAFFCFSCGNKEKAAENTSTNSANALTDGHYEYLFVQDKDSSFLSIDIKGADVTGNYTFKPEVSDGAVGEIKAQKTNNRIDGMMAFTVEGSAQTEAMYLDIQGTDLIWKRYELKEDPTTKALSADTTKLVNTQKFVLKK